MVNTGDIHEAGESAKRAAEAVKSDEKLDDVMLAMDVVDTLRHERLMVEKELSSEDRREALITRLKDIYRAQGIDVPDDVLMDGVLALEEQRYVYDPPQTGLGRSLATFYVNRRKWLPLFYTFVFILGGASAINYFGFERPQRLDAQRTERLLTKTLPDQLSEAHQEAINIATTDDIKSRANDLYSLADDAIKNKDAKQAEKYTNDLKGLTTDLSQRYTLRVVSRPGEYSGVFRINEDGTDAVRNYYLIVEGITPSGDRAKVLINSEEDQKTQRTQIWGVRVPEAVFNRVAADKKDDQIIQNAIIGEKQRGHIEPNYKIETSGGLILDW